MEELVCPQCGAEIDNHNENWHLDQWVYIDVDGYELPHYGHSIPLYSTDLEEAFRIVSLLEHNHTDEILFSCVRKGSEHKNILWHVTFRKCKGNQYSYYAKAKTLPLAICRAAIKAVNNYDGTP